MNIISGPGAQPPVIENTPEDAFNNAIRIYGITNACGWFDHNADSEFTAETIRVLAERAERAAA